MRRQAGRDVGVGLQFKAILGKMSAAPENIEIYTVYMAAFPFYSLNAYFDVNANHGLTHRDPQEIKAAV